MDKSKLDTIVKKGLENYSDIFQSINFFTKETSTIYKVVNTESETFALKIYDDNSSNVLDNQIEVLILEAIQKKGSIPTTTLVKNKDNQFLTVHHNSATNTSYRMVLSRWLEGSDLEHKETPALFFNLGQLVAELHLITKEMTIPKDLEPKKWNQVFYFRDEKAVYHEGQYQNIVSEEFKTLMDLAIPLLNQKLQQLYDIAPPQLLHGDLNPCNIKLQDGQLALLDFEDAILGHPIHDLAILLFYYEDHDQFSYELVKNKVLEGYRSVSRLPNLEEQTIKMLSIARTVNFLNHVLTLEEDYSKFIKKSLEKLKAYLQAN